MYIPPTKNGMINAFLQRHIALIVDKADQMLSYGHHTLGNIDNILFKFKSCPVHALEWAVL